MDFSDTSKQLDMERKALELRINHIEEQQRFIQHLATVTNSIEREGLLLDFGMKFFSTAVAPQEYQDSLATALMHTEERGAPYHIAVSHAVMFDILTNEGIRDIFIDAMVRNLLRHGVQPHAINETPRPHAKKVPIKVL